MSIVEYELNGNENITEDEIEMIHKASEMRYVPDEDCPELSERQIAEFKKIINERKRQKQKQTVSLRLSNSTLSIAKSLGKSYTTILATVLENIFQNPEELKRFL